MIIVKSLMTYLVITQPTSEDFRSFEGELKSDQPGSFSADHPQPMHLKAIQMSIL
jgi:hypothetical protein